MPHELAEGRRELADLEVIEFDGREGPMSNVYYVHERTTKLNIQAIVSAVQDMYERKDKLYLGDLLAKEKSVGVHVFDKNNVIVEDHNENKVYVEVEEDRKDELFNKINKESSDSYPPGDTSE